MKKRAFTLAEVLIVIALIGFLCTLTLPTFVQTRGSSKFIEKAQKNRELVQVAINEVSAMNHNYTPDDWESVRTSSNKSQAIIKELSKRLKILSYCGSSPTGCFAAQGYKTLGGVKTDIVKEDMKSASESMEKESYRFDVRYEDSEFDNNYDSDSGLDSNNISVTNENLDYTTANPKYSSTYVSLLEGGSLVLKTSSTYCNGKMATSDGLDRPLCGIVYIDVNGPDVPNILGVDLFGFYLSGTSLLPMGFYGDDFKFSENCRRDLKNNKANGLACSAWALVNKNMDYRKCVAGKVIDWTTKTRCNAQSSK